MWSSRLKRKRQEWATSRQSLSDPTLERSSTKTSIVEYDDQLNFDSSEPAKKEYSSNTASPTQSPLRKPLVVVEEARLNVPSTSSKQSLIATESPFRRKSMLAACMRVNSMELLKGCTPKFFRRRSSEHLMGKKNRTSRSQSPSKPKRPNNLESPEIVRRLSDCSPVTKSGFPYKKFTDPYFIGSSPTKNKRENCQERVETVPGISISLQPDDGSDASKNSTRLLYSTTNKGLRPDMKLGSTSFDTDELQSEVQELPSNMPRRKSRTGIFDGLYTSFSTTRKLRLVHQLSMDETRSDVYMELADLASSGKLDNAPPIPYVGDLSFLIPANRKRRDFQRQQHLPYSAPTSLDEPVARRPREETAVTLCLDAALRPATLLEYDLALRL